ncbi:transglutaminase domain-containing protein [Candidatus Bathyarchaeota archaeon]|nr:transglutaminase domain-containing protein [Candidatus Bathyarchaeota archaeon]
MIQVRDGWKTLSLIFLILASNVPHIPGQPTKRYLYTTFYSFENRGDQAYDLTEEDLSIALFFNDSWQIVTVINSTALVLKENVDEDGNKYAILDLPYRIQPNSCLNFSVSYLIEVSEKTKLDIDVKKAGGLDDIPIELVQNFTGETETFTIHDRSVYQLAHQLALNETTVLGVVLKFVSWFISNISYGSFETPRYPNETLLDRRGDCDDQAILLVTMLRSVGIPAYLQIGIVFNEDIQGKTTSWNGHLRIEKKGVGWHGWAMVYIPPWGWVPIDLTLESSKTALSKIVNAPEYKDFIVYGIKVSNQPYVREAYEAREKLMKSKIYITNIDSAIQAPTEGKGVFISPTVVIIGLSITVLVIITVLLRRSKV